MKTDVYLIIYPSIFLRKINISGKICRENQNTCSTIWPWKWTFK